MRQGADAAAEPRIRVVGMGVDSLYLAVWVEPDPTVLARLGEWRDQARRAGRELEVELAGIRWALLPHGRRHYDVVLTNDMAELRLRTGRTPGAMPRAMLELRAVTLWTRGLERAVAWARGVVASVGQVSELRVSRADIAVDLAVREGQLFPRGAAHIGEWVSRAVRRGAWSDVQAYQLGRKFTGFRFGGDQLLVRVYDKALEAAVTGRERWWRSVWRVGPEVSVWRVEVQLRAEALREFGVRNVEQLSERLTGIWRYVTQHWVSWRRPRGANQTRWPVRRLWAWISQLSLVAPGTEVVRKAVRDLRVERLLRGIVGYMAALSAAWQEPVLEQVARRVMEGVTATEWQTKRRRAAIWTQALVELGAGA